jgi:hypothetical protein
MCFARSSKHSAMFRDPKYISVRVSLVILASGFFLLGTLALVSRAQGNWTGEPCREADGCCLGSVVSIFTGVIFLGAACKYWRG